MTTYPAWLEFNVSPSAGRAAVLAAAAELRLPVEHLDASRFRVRVATATEAYALGQRQADVMRTIVTRGGRPSRPPAVRDEMERG